MDYYFVKLIVLAFFWASVKGENCDDCLPPKYISHYEAQGCRPISKADCPDCILRYECPSKNETSNPSKCFYGGKFYEFGERIEQLSPCEDCQCARLAGGNKSQVICAHIECPENLIGIQNMLQYSNFSAIDSDKCFIAYEPNQCCGKVKCPEEPKVEVAYTCNVDGKEYREGEHIYLDDCNLCVCKPDFNSSYATNNPYCHRVLCHFNLDLLATGCIPVFVGNGCCAIDHHCPTPSLQDRQRHCNDRVYEGPCSLQQKYKYNATLNQCLPYNTTSCALNLNLFETEEKCNQYCMEENLVKPEEPEMDKCYFDGINYDIGSVLQTNTQYSCTCKIPPTFTCVIPISE